MDEDTWKRLKRYLRKYMQGTDEALCLFHILMCILVLQYKYKTEPMTIADYITSIVSGVYSADLINGLMHMYLDTTNNKFIVDIVDGFQKHHKTPSDIINYTNYELLCETAILPFPLSVVLYNCINNTHKKHILVQIISLYSQHIFSLTHKYAHYMNHATDEQKNSSFGKVLNFLQENRIILSPSEHRKHHQAQNHDINFCSVNGWANPLLNAIVSHPTIHKALFEDPETSP
jgi:hypothetical protein